MADGIAQRALLLLFRTKAHAWLRSRESQRHPAWCVCIACGTEREREREEKRAEAVGALLTAPLGVDDLANAWAEQYAPAMRDEWTGEIPDAQARLCEARTLVETVADSLTWDVGRHWNDLRRFLIYDACKAIENGQKVMRQAYAVAVTARRLNDFWFPRFVCPACASGNICAFSKTPEPIFCRICRKKIPRMTVLRHLLLNVVYPLIGDLCLPFGDWPAIEARFVWNVLLENQAPPRSTARIAIEAGAFGWIRGHGIDAATSSLETARDTFPTLRTDIDEHKIYAFYGEFRCPRVASIVDGGRGPAGSARKKKPRKSPAEIANFYHRCRSARRAVDHLRAMDATPKLTPHDERRVAVAAAVDPRTVRAYLEGRSQRSTVAARIQEALAALGFQISRGVLSPVSDGVRGGRT